MKRRDFAKALAVTWALLTGDSKGLYDRDGHRKVIRGVVEKADHTVVHMREQPAVTSHIRDDESFAILQITHTQGENWEFHTFNLNSISIPTPIMGWGGGEDGHPIVAYPPNYDQIELELSLIDKSQHDFLLATMRIRGSFKFELIYSGYEMYGKGYITEMPVSIFGLNGEIQITIALDGGVDFIQK